LNRLFYFCIMEKKQVKRNLVLAILFFLPVTFLLFLYPAQHHYNPLDVVKGNVMEVKNLVVGDTTVAFANHISVLGFAGNDPMSKVTALSNVKELVYDKFKGFKKFQVVIVVPLGAEDRANELQKVVSAYENLEYLHFVFLNDENINALYNSLGSDLPLDSNLATNTIFIIDKDLNQRGRMDDRSDAERGRQASVYGLLGYNAIEVAELKNKMSEDMRILFTEYRQKRKGTFDAATRRENSLKSDVSNEEN